MIIIALLKIFMLLINCAQIFQKADISDTVTSQYLSEIRIQYEIAVLDFIFISTIIFLHPPCIVLSERERAIISNLDEYFSAFLFQNYFIQNKIENHSRGKQEIKKVFKKISKNYKNTTKGLFLLTLLLKIANRDWRRLTQTTKFVKIKQKIFVSFYINFLIDIGIDIYKLRDWQQNIVESNVIFFSKSVDRMYKKSFTEGVIDFKINELELDY